MSVRDSHFIYEGLRKAFLLGLRVKPILRDLNLTEGESLLDAGCGYGVFHRYCQGIAYTGVDSDPSRIEWAKRELGEDEKNRFIHADITKTGLSPKSFDKAIGYGLLHHLSDEAAGKALEELSRLVCDYVVFSDPVRTKYHFINTFLCNLDRGEYVRYAEGYEKLCEPYFRIESARYFYARNGLAKYYLIKAVPKS